MKLIELIISVLEKVEKPLQQKEIFELCVEHPTYNECNELKRVQVPISAVARCLTKYSSGSNTPIGIVSESKDKVSFKNYFLKSKNYEGLKFFSEADLHPYLVKFAFERFNVYSKTINALKSSNTKNKIGKWTNPDIVGVNPVILQKNGRGRNFIRIFFSNPRSNGLFKTILYN